MNPREQADVFSALAEKWPEHPLIHDLWEDMLDGLPCAPVLAAIEEISQRGEAMPKPMRVKAIAAGYAALDHGVCRLCDNSGFIFESAEAYHTVRPCDRCRPQVYSRWLAGAYRSTTNPQVPTPEQTDAAKVRLDEARESLTP